MLYIQACVIDTSLATAPSSNLIKQISHHNPEWCNHSNRQRMNMEAYR